MIEVSLRFSSQQPPVIYVKCDRLQPRIEPVVYDLSPARGTAIGHVADKGQERSSMQPKQSPEQPSALTNCFISPNLICNGGSIMFFRSTRRLFIFFLQVS